MTRLRTSALRWPRTGGGALALLYVAIALTPLALATGRPVAPLEPWERFGAGLGLAPLTAMAMQFVTSGRFRSVSGGLGIDKIMAFHKIAAWWVLGALLLHPFAYVLPTVLDDPDLGRRRLVAYLTLPQYRTGVVALVALALLVAGSRLRESLPLRYEAWRAFHVALAVTAAGAGLHHALTAGRFSALGPVEGWWWGVSGALVAVMGTLYGWRWIRLHLRPWRLHAVTKLADRTWELDIRPAPGGRDLRYEAGQFLWMTEGARRFPLFDHPFSIADSPMRPGLRLIVKEAGDFTDRIGALPPGAPIGVDGPHGEFSLENHAGDSVLLVAGGAGLGPIMGLLRDLAARKDPRPVRLAYAVAHPLDFACLEEIEAAMTVLSLRVLPVCETEVEGYAGAVGRLDRPLLDRLLEGLEPRDAVAMICGPGPMVVAVSDALHEIGLPMERIVYERFDYASGAASRQDRRRLRRFLLVGAGLAAGVALFAALPH
ncbi:MAG: iron reductase [Rhodobacteraceae bacterium]|nr:MAG: iron reductase [Paracoccaceae bacterium]